MGARVQLDLPPGRRTGQVSAQRRRYAKDMKVIQLDHRARGDRPQQGDRGGLGRPTGRAVGPPEDRLWQGDPRLRGGTGHLN